MTMTGQEIAERLRTTHDALSDRDRASRGVRTAPANGKWSPAQHLEHIRIGLALTNKALGLLSDPAPLAFRQAEPPGQGLRRAGGPLPRKLSAGGRAPSRFVPKQVDETDSGPEGSDHGTGGDPGPESGRWSDRRMDSYLVPHPLLGNSPCVSCSTSPATTPSTTRRSLNAT